MLKSRFHYKKILDDRRRNLTEANIECYNVVHYNQFLYEKDKISNKTKFETPKFFLQK